MRRRRTARQARERWVWGNMAPLAGVLNSQAAMAAQYPQVERIVDLLGLEPGKRYLDFGPGTAGFAHLLAQGAGLEEAPVCMDITPGPGPVDIFGWPEKLPFADDSFDCITSFHLLRRFDDDVSHAFGQELSRILAPGGAGLIVEYAPVRSARLNRLHERLLGYDCAAVDLRGWGRMAALLTECEFGAIDLVNLGTPILPPIPRLAVLVRHFPEGWDPEDPDGEED